jgi:RNA methyltransferase, TrmH family
MITKSQVKYIQSLGQKKLRDQDQVFVAEGPKVINELLATGFIQPVALYAVKEWLQEQEAGFLNQQLPATVISEAILESISFLSTPNRVLGIFKKPTPNPFPDFSKGISLMLDDIQDPGNLGTIIRTADWFGVSQIICSPSTADAYAPKVVQSTMGSIARVQLLYGDLDTIINTHPTAKLYAATLAGKPLYQLDKIDQGVIVIGNESKGVRPSIVKLACEQITIPRTGKAESLNAAVATGIILSKVVG